MWFCLLAGQSAAHCFLLSPGILGFHSSLSPDIIVTAPNIATATASDIATIIVLLLLLLLL